MNLLIIGNGLDLDLGLPTKYTDFLKFANSFMFFISPYITNINEFDINNTSTIVRRYDKLYSPHLANKYKETEDVLEKFDKCFSNKLINKACKDLHYCLHNNCWIKYFNERYTAHFIVGENWIDLESEIQRVIKLLEDKRILYINGEKDIISTTPANFNLNQLDIQTIINASTKITLFRHDFNKLKNVLLKDFDRFVMALGIYLDFFVGQLPIKIENASKELIDMMTDNVPNKIDCVLSFNYKNNFMNKNSLSDTCYIHGFVNYLQELNEHISEKMSETDKNYMSIEEIIKRNKMIVGFDDLHASDEDFELEFVDYRKYFQRIYKGTASQYVDWLNEYQVRLKKSIRTTESPINWEDVYQKKCQAEISCSTPNNIFIFGHSLDATDNEIFKDIFLRELNDTRVTIYYIDSESRKRIITNLIKILTKPILVEKTKGNEPYIKFIQQTKKS